MAGAGASYGVGESACFSACSAAELALCARGAGGESRVSLELRLACWLLCCMQW